MERDEDKEKDEDVTEPVPPGRASAAVNAAAGDDQLKIKQAKIRKERGLPSRNGQK